MRQTSGVFFFQETVADIGGEQRVDNGQGFLGGFGEFRLLPNGKALLVGMADANLKAITVSTP